MTSAANLTIGRTPVAILYQAIDPPIIDGVRKPRKPTGYADSGADIACALVRQGIPVIVPNPEPDEHVDGDWVWPDSTDGIDAAIAAGATTLWANTILFDGHPLERVADVAIVGQLPHTVHIYDDKWRTNEDARARGLPVAPSCLIGRAGTPDVIALTDVSEVLLRELGVQFPAVVKPVRGRGSQGVVMVTTLSDLRTAATELLDEMVEVDGRTFPKYGEKLILESFLPGEEITVTVMPPGVYANAAGAQTHERCWSTPAVLRVDQVDGIIPYNGTVPVAVNSRAIDSSKRLSPILDACAEVGDMIGARAPIRVDCRADQEGRFLMFDINMKPNMTGTGRPGRDLQDSLTSIAVQALGWTYEDLVANMLAQAWGPGR